MSIEMCAATDVKPDVDTAKATGASTAATEISMVEVVASTISGIAVIGQARNALQAAGRTATIAANRITVDDLVVAQLIPAKMGTYGMINASWVVSSTLGTDPVWIVGAGPASLCR